MKSRLSDRVIALLTLLGLAIAIEVGLADFNSWFSLSLNVMELTSFNTFTASQQDISHIGVEHDLASFLLHVVADIIRSHWA